MWETRGRGEGRSGDAERGDGAITESRLVESMKTESRPKGRWTLVEMLLGRGAEEFARSLAFDLGSTGIVTLEENTESVRLGAYFDHTCETSELTRRIQSGLGQAGADSALLELSSSEVPDQDWMQKWKEGFEPFEIGERLLVTPTWKIPPADSTRVVIRMDPGMAFGTGTHETTGLCLEAIERYWRGDCLLDVGTGTGILGIAAALLRPGSRITAIDIDPQAVRVARENVEMNGVSAVIDVFEAQPGGFTGRAYDVVVANLTAEVIVSLASDLAGCLANGGTLIVSGVLNALADDVQQALEEEGLSLLERIVAGEWSALVATRS